MGTGEIIDTGLKVNLTGGAAVSSLIFVVRVPGVGDARLCPVWWEASPAPQRRPDRLL